MSTETRHHTHSSARGRTPDRPSRQHADGRAMSGSRRAEEPSDTAGGFSRILRTLPLSLGLTAVMGLLLLTVATAIAYNMTDPAAVMVPLAYGALGVTALAGGLLAGGMNRDCPIQAGLVSGCACAVLLFLLSLLGGEPSDMIAARPAVAWLMRLGVILLHVPTAYMMRSRPKSVGHHTGHGHGH